MASMVAEIDAEVSSCRSTTPEHQSAGLPTFAAGDMENPRNWPLWHKWLIVGVIIPVDLSVSWAASGFSPAIGKFMEDMHVPEEIAVLGLSLYVLGLAWGPMTLAPLSEVPVQIDAVAADFSITAVRLSTLDLTLFSSCFCLALHWSRIWAAFLPCVFCPAFSPLLPLPILEAPLPTSLSHTPPDCP